MLILQNRHLWFIMKTPIVTEEERGCCYVLWLDYDLLWPFALRSERVSLRAFCLFCCSCCQVMWSPIQGPPQEKVKWSSCVEHSVATVHVCACVCMHGCRFVWVRLSFFLTMISLCVVSRVCMHWGMWSLYVLQHTWLINLTGFQSWPVLQAGSGNGGFISVLSDPIDYLYVDQLCHRLCHWLTCLRSRQFNGSYEVDSLKMDELFMLLH